MKEKNMQSMSNSGIVEFELNEIHKLQKNPDGFLSMWSNTCADFTSVICC